MVGVFEGKGRISKISFRFSLSRMPAMKLRRSHLIDTEPRIKVVGPREKKKVCCPPRIGWEREPAHYIIIRILAFFTYYIMILYLELAGGKANKTDLPLRHHSPGMIASGSRARLDRFPMIHSQSFPTHSQRSPAQSIHIASRKRKDLSPNRKDKLIYNSV